MGLTAKGSKKDLMRAIKLHLEIPEEFLKIFSKFWGGSGKASFYTFRRMLEAPIVTRLT